MSFVAVDVHFTRVAGDAYSSQTWPFPLIREEAAGTAIPHLKLINRGAVGIITFDGAKLTPTHLTQLRVANVEKMHIIGPDDNGELKKLVRDGAKYNHVGIEEELVASARDSVKQHPDMGALVLECTQMAPFAEAIQKAVKLPVYDVYTMGCWFYSGLVRTRPTAWGPINGEGPVA